MGEEDKRNVGKGENHRKIGQSSLFQRTPISCQVNLIISTPAVPAGSSLHVQSGISLVCVTGCLITK